MAAVAVGSTVMLGTVGLVGMRVLAGGVTGVGVGAVVVTLAPAADAESLATPATLEAVVLNLIEAEMVSVSAVV